MRIKDKTSMNPRDPETCVSGLQHHTQPEKVSVMNMYREGERSNSVMLKAEGGQSGQSAAVFNGAGS